MNLHIFFACLVLMLGNAATAKGTIETWNGDGTKEVSLSVAAGDFAEVCAALPQDAEVQWRYRATQAVDFNIHFHVGKDVTYVAREKAATAENTLNAKRGEDYCWMWSNKTPAVVQLEVKLERRK